MTTTEIPRMIEGKPDTVEVRLVCLGRRFQDGKLYVRFAEEGTDYAQAGLFPLNPRTRRYQVGGIFRVQMNEERTVATFTSDPWQHMDGQLPAEEVAALRIASEAAEAEQRRFKGSKKVGDTEAVLDVLEPLRRIYQTADKTNRRLIELTVLDYLRRPP